MSSEYPKGYTQPYFVIFKRLDGLRSVVRLIVLSLILILLMQLAKDAFTMATYMLGIDQLPVRAMEDPSSFLFGFWVGCLAQVWLLISTAMYYDKFVQKLIQIELQLAKIDEIQRGYQLNSVISMDTDKQNGTHYGKVYRSVACDIREALDD